MLIMWQGTNDYILVRVSGYRGTLTLFLAPYTHTHTPQGNIHTHQLEKTDMFNDENLSCGEAGVVQRKHLNLPNDFEEV